MELFNNLPSYHYGIRIIDGKVMIPTKSIAEHFDMRHSNVMRACENARKHLTSPERHYHSVKFNFGGKFNPGYYVSRGVFNIITKRVKDKSKQSIFDAYMRVLEESEATEPVNYHETIPVIEESKPIPATEPVNPTAPEKTFNPDFNALMNRIDELEKKLTRLAAIEEKLDFIISNAIKAGNAKPVIIPETAPVTISNEPISISELAKMLNQSGVKIGEMRLFQFLREKNYLCAFGSEYNLPRQKYIEQGLFIIKSSRVQLPTGQVVEKNTTKVTAKGQEYFINKFIYDQSHNA